MDARLLSTGAANVASVEAAFHRLGVSLSRATTAAHVASADALIVPGVGSFAAGMAALQQLGVVDALRDRVAAGKPTLGVCLGMQLFADRSDESGGLTGICAVNEPVIRLPADARVPQLGWNAVHVDERCVIATDGRAFYANSYRLAGAPAGWAVGWTTHGARFPALVERGAVLLCQFHPELSGQWGASLLGRWLDRAAGRPLRAPGQARSGPAGLGPRIVPCLDIRDGRVVKGVRFQGLRDAGDPVALAARYAEQGADELVILDVSATPDGRATAAETVAAVRAVLDLPLTVGGGVRAEADAARLLDAGADKVAVNTAAVADPSLLTRLANRFGTQCVVLALDAAQAPNHSGSSTSWEVVTHSGKSRTGRDACAWMTEAETRGAGEILLTSWDRDGTRQGYDLDLLRAARGSTNLPIVASGGADHAAHLADALRAGADAVLAASIFHGGETTVADVRAALIALGVPA